jgi:hypothetical protein
MISLGPESGQPQSPTQSHRVAVEKELLCRAASIIIKDREEHPLARLLCSSVFEGLSSSIQSLSTECVCCREGLPCTNRLSFANQLEDDNSRDVVSQPLLPCFSGAGEPALHCLLQLPYIKRELRSSYCLQQVCAITVAGTKLLPVQQVFQVNTPCPFPVRKCGQPTSSTSVGYRVVSWSSIRNTKILESHTVPYSKSDVSPLTKTRSYATPTLRSEKV